MYADAKRRDLQLLLAGGVFQKRLAELTGVSVRSSSRIGHGPARLKVAAEPVAHQLPNLDGTNLQRPVRRTRSNARILVFSASQICVERRFALAEELDCPHSGLRARSISTDGSNAG